MQRYLESEELSLVLHEMRSALHPHDILRELHVSKARRAQLICNATIESLALVRSAITREHSSVRMGTYLRIKTGVGVACVVSRS